jgi:hypothetical protein
MTTVGIARYDDSVLEALDDLDEHLELDSVHETEIAQFIEDSPEVAESPGLLIAAGAVLLHEMKQVEFGGFRAYGMGDTIVVEESGEDGWRHAASVPHDVAVLVAQARAEERSQALMMEHDFSEEDGLEKVESQIGEGMFHPQCRSITQSTEHTDAISEALRQETSVGFRQQREKKAEELRKKLEEMEK